MREAIIGLCGLGLLLIAGRWFLAAPVPETPPAPPPVTAVERETTPPPPATPTALLAAPADSGARERVAELEKQVAELTERNADLEQQLEVLRRKPTVHPSVAFQNLQSGPPSRPRNAIRPDLSLDPDAATLLALKEPETQAVEEALRRARDSLKQLDIENARVTERAEQKLIVTVAPFPAAGEQVLATLQADLAKAIGDERARKLLEDGGLQNAQSFGQFGKATQTVTISHETAGQVRVTNLRVVESAGGKQMSSSVSIGNDLPANVAHLANLP